MHVDCTARGCAYLDAHSRDSRQSFVKILSSLSIVLTVFFHVLYFIGVSGLRVLPLLTNEMEKWKYSFINLLHVVLDQLRVVATSTTTSQNLRIEWISLCHLRSVGITFFVDKMANTSKPQLEDCRHNCT